MAPTIKPRIFIVSGKSPIGDSGGYPAYAYNLARMLHSLGYSVTIFAIREKAAVQKTQYATIHFVSTKLLHVFPLLKHLALAGLPYYSIILFFTMKKVILASHIRHCVVWGMGPWGFPGVLLKLFSPKNVTVRLIVSYFTSTRHEMRGGYDAIKISDYGWIPKIKYFLVYHIVAPIFHLFEWMTLHGCEQIIVHYKSSTKIIQQYFGVASDKITRFPWHVDIFSREGKSTQTKKRFRHPLLVSISRQDPRKGLNFIIRAMIPVAQEFPSVQCLIVGSGEFLHLNKKLVKKLGLTKNVVVTGFVPDIRPILKEADIFLVVPRAQGSSALTVLEAMSYGKAIIASDCDGIPEDVKDNYSALIVPKADSQALAAAMRMLIKNPALRRKLGANAYTSYQKRFGFSKMKQKLREVLQHYSYA